MTSSKGKFYPVEITPEILERHRGIDDAEIQKDINDTQQEIVQLGKMQEGYRIFAQHHLSEFERQKADLAVGSIYGEIQNRENFINYLKRVQAARLVHG